MTVLKFAPTNKVRTRKSPLSNQLAPKQYLQPEFSLIECENSLQSFIEDQAISKETVIAFPCEQEVDVVSQKLSEFALSPNPHRTFVFRQDSCSVEVWRSVIAQVNGFFLSSKNILVGHDLKPKLQLLRNSGFKVHSTLFDTMIASYVLHPGSRDYTLESCFRNEGTDNSLAEFDPPLSQISSGKSSTDGTLAIECRLVWRLRELLQKHIASVGLKFVFEEIEMQLLPILADIEQLGIHVESWVLGELAVDLNDRIEKLRAHIFQMAGEEFNVNSSQQVGRILFDKLKMHARVDGGKLKRRKNGPSTDLGVLEKLSIYPLPGAILEFRGLARLKGTYVDALPQLVHLDSQRIHTKLHQAVTGTGRLSSSQPNLQNIPMRTDAGREIRRAFRAEKPGHLLISADYSQVELRLLAHLSREPALISAFRSGKDVHAETASRVFRIEPDQVSSDMRSRAKAVNFGVMYGMGAYQLAEDTGSSLRAAEDFIQRYFSEYPKVYLFIQAAIQEAVESGYSRTIFGRRRPIPFVRRKGRVCGGKAAKMAVNSVIQGSAADLIKVAMIRTNKGLKDEGLATQMILQVHDELVFEGPESELGDALRIIRTCMESAVTLDVPLHVNMGYGRNWLESHFF